jgi:hypothetical protein
MHSQRLLLMHVPLFIHSKSQVGGVVARNSSGVDDGSSNDVVDDSSKDIVDGSSKDVVDGSSKDVVDGTSGDVVDGSSDDVVEDTTNDVVDGALDDVLGLVTTVVVFGVAFVGRGAHVLRSQIPLMQSLCSLQILLTAHFKHLSPPQSMSVSPLFFFLSVQPFSSGDGRSSEFDECSCECDACSPEADECSCECAGCSCEDDACSCECECAGGFFLSSLGRAIQCQQQITSKSNHT